MLVTGRAGAMGWMTLAAQQPLHFLRVPLAGYVCRVLTTFLVGVLATGRSLPTLQILLCIPLYFWWWRLLWQRAEFSAVVLKRARATGMCGGAFGMFGTHRHYTCSCQSWLSVAQSFRMYDSWYPGCPSVALVWGFASGCWAAIILPPHHRQSPVGVFQCCVSVLPPSVSLEWVSHTPSPDGLFVYHDAASPRFMPASMTRIIQYWVRKM